MSVNNHHQPSPLKKFRLSVYISAVVIILFLTLLLWIYRSESRFTISTPPYKAANKTTMPVKPTLPPKLSEKSPDYKATTEPKKPVKPTLPAQCGSGYIVPEGEKVTVKTTKTVLLSAYREHRTGINEVRVISVALTTKAEAYRCHLCCQEKLYISEGVSSLHSDHFGFAYGTTDIMCPMPSGCETASYIAVTSAADDSEDKPDKEFFEVKNQKAKSDTFPYDFTVCLSTMYDFTNVLQLVQSLEMMQLLGVNRVAVYKTNCSPETQRILDYYTDKGLIEVIPWSLSRFLTVSRFWQPQLGPGELHYFGQIPALNDCVYRYMYQSRYVALQDIDELILPQKVNSWLELLPLLEKEYGVDKCYKFEVNVFANTNFPPPTSKHLPRQIPSWKNVPGLNILAHLYQIPYDVLKRTNYKIIVNPRAVFSATVHGLLSSTNGCSWVDGNVARLYHTSGRTKTELTPDQMIYDDRLLSYSDRFIQNVNTVLKECGLLQEDSIY